MAKLELVEETEPNGEVYYYITLDGRILHCEKSGITAVNIFETVKKNYCKKKVEILKSEEV